MILVDTSVWIDHLREPDENLLSLLVKDAVVLHPFVLGEIALGHLKDRKGYLRFLAEVRTAPLASDIVVNSLIEERQLFGTGIGYVDCHLLASTRSVAGAKLWTRDKRLAAAAIRLDCLADSA